MATQATETITFRIPKGQKEALKKIVKSSGIDATIAKSNTGFVKGKYKKGEKPSDYSGGWESNPVTAEEIREKAWRRN